MSNTIAQYIHHDLIHRIEQGDLPESFSLQHLSGHYQVSITPIRQALQQLVAENYLLKQASGRLELNANRDPETSQSVPIASSSPQVNPSEDRAWVEQLRRSIIGQSILGETIFLREEATAKEYGVGRTVIRQVFSRFAGTGLLHHLPRRGWQIRKFNVSDMQHFLQARQAMELTALDQACDRLDPKKLQQMLKGNEPEDSESTLDNNLHRYLVECSENPYIQDFFQRHGLYYSILFGFAAPQTDVVQEMAQQHRTILESLLKQDWPAAKAALSEHIAAQEPIMVRYLQQVTQNNPKIE